MHYTGPVTPLRLRICVLALCCAVAACSTHVQPGEALDAATRHRLYTLFHMPDSEAVIQFYTPYKGEVGGNFVTARRLGTYWVHEDDTMRKDTASAFYPLIAAIDTVRDAGFSYAPYMRVQRRDTSSFKVYAAGTQPEVTRFFCAAIAAWRASVADSSEDSADED